jgi:hypothetical protein
MCLAGRKIVVNIHVFAGGKYSTNFKIFKLVIHKVIAYYQREAKKLGFEIRFEVISKDAFEVRQLDWTLHQFVSWLSLGDVYLILGHPAQGLSDRQSFEESSWQPWDLSQLGTTLNQHLGKKIGWPENLLCPVFLQDKITYKKELGSLGTPFLILERTPDGRLTLDQRKKVFKFCFDHRELPRRAENSNYGWVLKSPYTTCSYGRAFCPNIYDIPKKFGWLCRRQSTTGVPAFFLEPRYANRKVFLSLIYVLYS